MRIAENERSEVWSVRRIIPQSGGYNTPPLAAKCFQSLLWGSYPWL